MIAFNVHTYWLGNVMRLDNRFILSILPDSVILQGELQQKTPFCVDTRTLRKGDIFIAIQGAHQDGHDFIQEAINKGTSGIIIEKKKRDTLKTIRYDEHFFIMLVEHSSEDIITLARAWRSLLTMPIIGITGSVGKTSTKELLTRVLKNAGKRVYATAGNQNTLLGISLNLLQVDDSYDYVICEMGIGKRGEMARLADLVHPTYALITAIGHAHMEGLGGLQDIALEKRQIFKNFSQQSIGVIQGDQPLLATIAYNHPVLKFGFKTTNQVQARKVHIGEASIEFVLKIYTRKYKVVVPTNHETYVNTIIAATALAVLLGIPDEVIIKTIQEPLAIQGRFFRQALKNGRGYLIDDCYNANPESMKSALVTFERMRCEGKKIAILGDMRELGPDTVFWHRQVGRFLRKAPTVRHLILVGSSVQHIAKTAPVGCTIDLVATWQEGLACLEKLLASEHDALVLVKGSTSGYRGGLVHIIQASVAQKHDDASMVLSSSSQKEAVL